MKWREILRWVTVAGFGGLGLFILAGNLLGLIRERATTSVSLWVFAVGATLLMTGPLIAIGYFALRRQYRGITVILAAIASLALPAALLALIRQFDDTHIPMGPVGFLALLFLAPWTFRLCLRLADRYFLGAAGTQRPA